MGGVTTGSPIYWQIVGYAEYLFHIPEKILWITDKRNSGRVESEKLYGAKEKKRFDALAED